MRKIRKILILICLIYLSTILYRSVSFKFKYNLIINKQFDLSKDYPVIFDYNKDRKATLLDSNNVFYADYSKMKNLGVKNQISYNPVTIGLNSLRIFQEFLKDSSSVNKNIFLSNSNWLYNNIEEDGSWKFMHDKYSSGYLIKSPWVSALAQGIGISVLVRAFKITNDSSYLFCARRACLPFSKDIINGGVRSKNDFGLFYEEYPINNDSKHVLNGFIYSLYGLHDLWILDSNIIAKQYFDDGIISLKILYIGMI